MATVHVDPEREEAELAAYLGDRFDRDRLVHWERTLEEEAEGIGDEQALYRISEAYLYNLTAFAMTRTKLPYLRELARAVPAPARLLDYGCGIGSDGLALIEAGYEVAFADFDNPSTRYLRWRLERRGLQAELYDLDAGTPPGGFDAAYAFDVLEHVDDPFALLREMEERARLVVVNILRHDPEDTTLHRELPIRGLLGHAARHGLVHASRHHAGRVWLVAYRGQPGPPLAGAASAVRLLGALR